MSRILITMNEDARASGDQRFAVTYKVDEHDCLEYAAGLKALSHDVYFVNWTDFDGRGFERMFHDNEQRFVAPLPLEDFNLIWAYQMEGFYSDLSRFLHMVEVFEDVCPLVINDPATIRHNLGKQYLWELERSGVSVIPTYPVDERIVPRLISGERIVLKPLYGERGNGVIVARAPDDVACIAPNADQYIAQDYMASVRDGEKSLVFLGFDYQHAVHKHPCQANADEFRCNESLGGKVSVYEPTASELAYAQGVLRAYASLGYRVHYSRIDFIDTERGPTLMEAELLNPAAFANYSGKGREFGRKVAAYLDGLIESNRTRSSRPASGTLQQLGEITY